MGVVIDVTVIIEESAPHSCLVLQKPFLRFYFYYLKRVCVCVCEHKYSCLQRSELSHSPGARVTGACEMPDLGVWNPT